MGFFFHLTFVYNGIDIRQGPLRYYSGHLYWLHGQNEALISDTCRMNVAHLHGLGLRDLKTLNVIDPTLQPLPGLAMIPLFILYYFYNCLT